MAVAIAASAVRTCLGSGGQTFDALLRGQSGVGPLRHGDPAQLNVHCGYHISGSGEPYRASAWLASCVGQAVTAARVDPARERVAAIVGTGLRELSAVEAWTSGAPAGPAERLHFAGAVRAAVPGLTDVLTIANACSASGHALALAQDLLELDEADAVVVGGVDAMTESMLAMIGRVAVEKTEQVRPFDAARTGVLLGEGAAAAVVRRLEAPGPVVARLLGTGLSCDAYHETAPSPDGIAEAMRDAFARTGCAPDDVDLVVAHGTGTALNDPAESQALRTVLGAPLVTAVKGATGHTSGAAALVNMDVAIRCLERGVVPPIVGLRDVLPEGAGLRFVVDRPQWIPVRRAMVNAFGFGGVNAVTLVEAA